MRDDYVWHADPAVRAKNKADRAVIWLNEEMAKPGADFGKLWMGCRSRFLYDLTTRYREQNGKEIYEAVKAYYQHMKSLRRTKEVLAKAVSKGVWGDNGLAAETWELKTGHDAHQQMQILWSLATAQTQRAEEDDDGE